MRTLASMIALTALVASAAGYLYLLLFQRGPDPHTWFNDSRRAAAMGLPILPDYFVNKGLALNTVDNLRRVHPGLGDRAERQRLLESGWLHGQLAYLRLRRGRYVEAVEAAQAAFGAKTAAARPNDDDYLRLGIAQFRSGQQEEGWSNICQALCIGSGIERRNPTYARETVEIWRLQTGGQGPFEAFVTQLRAARRQPLPAIELQSDSGTRRRLTEPTGQVLLVNFFSTHCGSCRQELAHLKDGLAALAADPRVGLIFVLNDPEAVDAARRMLEESGFASATIWSLTTGNAYDYIDGEPSVWLVDRTGRVAFRHVGYQVGDEGLYRQELTELLED